MKLRTNFGTYFAGVCLGSALLMGCVETKTSTPNNNPPVNPADQDDKDVPEPKPTEPAPPRSAGSPCGLEGDIQTRLKDCALVPDSIAGEWQIVSRAENLPAVWFHAKSGNLMTDPDMDQSKNYFDARDVCRALSIEEVVLRVPTASEWSEIEKAQSLKYPEGEYWTSTINNRGWMKMMSRSTNISHAHPYQYQGKVRCVGKLSNEIKQPGYRTRVSDTTYRYRNDCYLDPNKVSPGDVEAAKSLFHQDAETICGTNKSKVGELQIIYGCTCQTEDFLCYRSAVLTSVLTCQVK